MASISDSLYTAGGNLMQMRGDLTKPLSMPVLNYNWPVTETERVPEGMEDRSVWSSTRTGGNVNGPSNYPCAFSEDQFCAKNYGQECGRSLVMRENSIWPQVTGSADGSGYRTTALLPPSMPYIQLGFCIVSRKAIPSFKDIDGTVYDNGVISQLFMDGIQLRHYYSGKPFFFKTDATPFLYLLPNVIMVRVSGIDYKVSVGPPKEACNSFDCP